MFVIRFQGGLGNQMFQYAFYRSMKHRYPMVHIKADLSAYLCSKFHYGYELGKVFGIKVDEAIKEEVMKLSHYKVYSNNCIMRVYQKIRQKIFPLHYKRKSTEMIETKFCRFSPDFFQLDIKRDYFLEGYWCNENYFKEIRSDIFEEFSFKENFHEEYPLLKDIQSSNSVSVHIRRGDYVNTNFDVVNEKYYLNAINYINRHINKARFFVFSDDIYYVKEKFKLDNIVFVNDNTGDNSWKDMLLMSYCKHNIIANSTFSYWGAFLNKNKDKIIIAPPFFSYTTQYPLANRDWIIGKND